MKVLKKGIQIQILLFTVFFLMGVSLIFTYFFPELLTIVNLVTIGIVVVFSILGYKIYKNPDMSIIIITPKEEKAIKYLTYGYFIVYVIRMVLASSDVVDGLILNVTSGVILMGIAVFGVLFQYRIFKGK
jgi:hypothetical protein